MKQFIKNLLVVFVGIVILFALYLYYVNFRHVGPGIIRPEEDTSNKPAENATDFPLKLPDNFKIEVFAKGLPGARVMAFDGFGNMWVSQTSLGKISYIEIKDQIVPTVRDGVLRNLDNPHGLVFDYKEPLMLYYAEEGKISKLPVYSDANPQKIADLPTQGGGHFTRTLKFGPDDRLYVSIGSSCNVCIEKDERRAAIYTLNRDGSDFKKFASGLRNTVFFDWSFLKEAFKKTGVSCRMHFQRLDLISMVFAKFYHDQTLERYNLNALAKFFGVENERAHSALADIRATFEIYKKLLAKK